MAVVAEMATASHNITKKNFFQHLQKFHDYSTTLLSPLISYLSPVFYLKEQGQFLHFLIFFIILLDLSKKK